MTKVVSFASTKVLDKARKLYPMLYELLLGEKFEGSQVLELFESEDNISLIYALNDKLKDPKSKKLSSEEEKEYLIKINSAVKNLYLGNVAYTTSAWCENGKVILSLNIKSRV